MMGLVIRRAEESDISMLVQNVVAMAYDSGGERLDAAVVLAGVSGLFQRPELGFYIVAENDGVIVGSLVIVYEWSDWRNGRHWWIHSVYVAPEQRRQGVYSKMYAFVKDEALISGDAKQLRLSVDKSNVRARKTYETLGMKESESVIYNAV